MDEQLYDEFGNYIGPELLSSDEESDIGEKEETSQPIIEDNWDEDEDDVEREEPERVPMEEEPVEPTGQEIILHEDKKYFLSAEETYGEGVEALVEDEDAQPITEPIIAPVKVGKFDKLEKEMPETTFDKNYMAGLMDNPTLVRNVAIIGHLHAGKTSLMDVLVQQTHPRSWDMAKEGRYTDVRVDEQQRGLSMKMTPMSLVLPGRKEKSYLFNLMDTPGHLDFSDEMSAAMRLADGVCIVVDCVEGVMIGTERALKYAIQEKVDITMLINKIDRLAIELKLPPADAFHKIRHTIDEVNELLVQYSGSDKYHLSPELGNVAFGSTKFMHTFTLESFAELYTTYFGPFDTSKLAPKLWGDFYYHSSSRTFKRTPPHSGASRSFVQFVLEPLYKIYSQTVGEEIEDLVVTLEQLGVQLKKQELEADVVPLMKVVMKKLFGSNLGLPEMWVRHVLSPAEGAKRKVIHTYTGPTDSAVAKNMIDCDAKAPVVFHVVKLYPKPDCQTFDAFGRVMCGSIKAGQQLQVLGEGYSPEDEEDMTLQEATSIWIAEARYRVKVSRVPAGCLALIEGVDPSITKTSTLVLDGQVEDPRIFRPLSFMTQSVVKVAIEPLNPSELPKMLAALRSVNKTFPLLVTKVEESGEHVVLGTGEIYLDSVLHDVRKMYSDVEIKVADPVVTFCETVTDTSSLKCFAETPNRKNKITMIAEPLEKGLSEDVENGIISLEQTRKQISDFFQTKYDWDILAARSIWAFGPHEQGPNILVDDTLPSEVDKQLLGHVKDSIIQGFQWGAREGPLCDEPIRNVKFKILDAVISDEPIARGGGQIIPTARRVTYSAFLLATPRLMEPVNIVEIQCPADCVAACYTVLGRRRGSILKEVPKAGSPLTTLRGVIPAIDSFGFETDLRTHTHGEGLSEDVSINKFFDDPMLLELAKQEAELIG